MLNRIYTMVPALAALLLIQACGDDPTPVEPLEVSHSEIRTGVDENVRGVFPDLDSTSTVWEESGLLSVFGGGPDEGDCIGVPEGDGGGDEGDCGEDNLELITGAEISETLLEKILIEENIETTEPHSVTYLIPEDVFCDSDEGDVPVGEEEPDRDVPEGEVDEEEEECEAPPFGALRIRVSSTSQGNYDIAILMGENRINTMNLRLYRDELAAELDLAGVKTILDEIEAAGDEIGHPEVMSGIVGVALRHPSASVYEARIDVLSDIVLRSSDPEAPVDVRIARASPVVSVSVDVEAKTATGTVGLGAVDLQAPLAFFSPTEETCTATPEGEEECFEEEAPEGTIAIHLGGLTGSAEFVRGSDTLRITNGGLGDDTTTVHIDGEQVLGLDFNAALGRRVDVTVSHDGEQLQAEVSPAFDLALALDLRHADMDAPQWTMDEDIRILLDGAEPAIIRIIEDSGVFQIVQGQLTLTSSSYGEISVAEGMCLWGPDDVEDTEPVEGEGESTDGEGDIARDDDDDGPLSDEHPFDALSSGVCQ